MDILIIDADLDGHWKRLDWLNGLNSKQTPWLAMYHLVIALGPRTGHKHNRQREPRAPPPPPPPPPGQKKASNAPHTRNAYDGILKMQR